MTLFVLKFKKLCLNTEILQSNYNNSKFIDIVIMTQYNQKAKVKLFYKSKFILTNIILGGDI